MVQFREERPPADLILECACSEVDGWETEKPRAAMVMVIHGKTKEPVDYCSERHSRLGNMRASKVQ